MEATRFGSYERAIIRPYTISKPKSEEVPKHVASIDVICFNK
jgi:hypothetical protein